MRGPLIGRPGWPPGKCQGDGSLVPIAAWSLRFAATARASVATGGERGDRLGQLDGHATEAETDVAVVGLDLADGHAAGRCHALGVAEDKQPSEAVFELEPVIVQEPARDVPAVLVVEQAGGPVPSGGRGEIAGGVLAGACPADEPAGFLAVHGLSGAEPMVKIGLLAGAQGEVVRVKPVQEGAAGQPPDHGGLLPGGGLSVVAAAHAPDQVPACTALNVLG